MFPTAHIQSNDAVGQLPDARNRAFTASLFLPAQWIPVMWPKVIIILFIVLILYNLGAGLYYMIVDKGQTKRTVNALTWRVGFSIALIVLVVLGILTGVITPHGING